MFTFDKKVERIYLNGSYDRFYYDSKVKAPDLENFLGYTVAEYPFNIDRTLFLDKETVHPLGRMYEHRGNKMHNFSTLTKKGNKMQGLREVSKLDDRTSVREIKDMEMPIYLYIVALKKADKVKNWKDAFKPELVIFEAKVKVEWN